jgi:hypothetical protein
MRRIHPVGVFAGVLLADIVPAYRLESTDRHGWARVDTRGCGGTWVPSCASTQGL